ncbi:MAG: diacylglycerol kinase family protein [bacterium]
MSYFYVYDKFVQEKRYEREIIRVEQKLTDIGIQGKVGRLALFRNAVELVRDEVRRGATTIVVVGNDATFHQLMGVLPELGIAVGFIPVGDSCRISQVLGVPPGAEACDVLSARLTETLDVGKINNQYFLTSVDVFHQNAVLDIDGKFKISTPTGGGIEVRNLGSLGYKDLKEGLADPRDGKLDTIIFADLPKEGIFSKSRTTQSSIPLHHLNIVGEGPLTAIVDGVECKFENIRIEAVPKILKVITGKGRLV